MPSASVVACADEDRAARLQDLFMAPHFRVYTNPDVIGVEMAGALKNVVAIAAGIADGMGFGGKSRAPLTFAGLAGMGDLVATCISRLSRNRTLGEALGRGRTLEQVVGEMRMVAEGVKSSRPVLILAEREGVEMPIDEHVVKVLYEGVAPADMAASLMMRAARPELHGIDSGASGVG